jgi:hypothetical protein
MNNPATTGAFQSTMEYQSVSVVSATQRRPRLVRPAALSAALLASAFASSVQGAGGSSCALLNTNLSSLITADQMSNYNNSAFDSAFLTTSPCDNANRQSGNYHAQGSLANYISFSYYLYNVIYANLSASPVSLTLTYGKKPGTNTTSITWQLTQGCNLPNVTGCTNVLPCGLNSNGTGACFLPTSALSFNNLNYWRWNVSFANGLTAGSVTNPDNAPATGRIRICHGGWPSNPTNINISTYNNIYGLNLSVDQASIPQRLGNNDCIQCTNKNGVTDCKNPAGGPTYLCTLPASYNPSNYTFVDTPCPPVTTCPGAGNNCRIQPVIEILDACVGPQGSCAPTTITGGGQITGTGWQPN